MSASGFTPIQLFRTTTASAAPTALSLADGELAINLTDEKLYFKNAAGVVKLLASNAGSEGTVTSVAVSGGTTGLTTSGGPITSSGTITLGGTLAVANGGTGVTTSTGTGSVVLNTSPTLVTPTLGVASATSLNVTTGQSVGWGNDQQKIVGVNDPSTLQFFAGASERMRIDSSGNVGIGTSSPDGTLHVHTSSAGAVTAWGNANNLTVESSGATGISVLAPDNQQAQLIFGSPSDNIGSIIRWVHDDNELQVGSHTSNGFLTFRTAIGSERMRIDSSGKVLVGTTTGSAGVTAARLQSEGEIASKGSAAGIFWEDRAGGVTSSANWYGWYASSGTNFLFNGSTNIASINGTTGAYTALSDADKKRDFEASPIGLNEIMALKPTLYRVKGEADGSAKHLGFLAQEVKDHIPQAYVETEGFIGLNDRPIIAALVKAVQELTARVAQLETSASTITFEGN